MASHYKLLQCHGCNNTALCRLTGSAQFLCASCHNEHLLAIGTTQEQRNEAYKEFVRATAAFFNPNRPGFKLDLGVGPPCTTPRTPEEQAPEIVPSPREVFNTTQVNAPMLQMDPEPDKSYDEDKLKSWLEKEMSGIDW
jgi:hypothetical protein